MLAAMNGHTATVKLLLDMGSDINAQVYGITHVYIVHWLNVYNEYSTCVYNSFIKLCIRFFVNKNVLYSFSVLLD